MNKKIYLDYAGSTPIDCKVSKVIYSLNNKFFANPSSIFSDGVIAKRIIDNGRNSIAKSLSAHDDEIIFTASGTESDALAIVGLVRNFNKNNKNILPHIITTTIEHPAVIDNCKMLEDRKEAEVTYISPDKGGYINPKEIASEIKANTILVSVMYANNEIGKIQSIQEIAKEIRYFRKNNNTKFPFFHTDACQAMNYLYTENIEKLGVDMLTFNSSKIYGPKGIGVLYKKRNIILDPLYMGGGQEFGLRSGTESLSLIEGVSMALKITNKIKEKEFNRVKEIRDYCISKLLSMDISPFKIILNGGMENRLPNNINISVIGILSELIVIELDAKGIEVSEKSACHSYADGVSHVIKSIRKDDNLEKYGSIRISLGRFTKKKDIDIFIKEFSKILNKYRDLA